jgi:hypothetical protein
VTIAYENPLRVEAPDARSAAAQAPLWQERLRNLAARYRTTDDSTDAGQ